MGGSSDSESTSTIRYAPYVENHHQNFLTISHEYLDLHRNDEHNPYSTLFEASQPNAPVDIDWMGVFYGAGYNFMSYPSLYDMYGKFMAGLDIEVLWTQALAETQDNSAVSAMTNAHADILDEGITDDILPRLRAGMRDINAITSSSYWIAVSNVEGKRDHDVAKFDAELRYKLIPIAADRWIRHLEWNKDVIRTYMEIIKFSILVRKDQGEINYRNKLNYIMWPWTLLEQQRANLGALQGARTTKAGEPNQVQSAIGGGLTGAAAGAMVTTSPWGAVVGGALGIASGFF